MEERTVGRVHRAEFENRAIGKITGIVEVIAFDENAVVLDTDLGILTIRGKDLHVSRLTLEKGEVDVDGMIDSLVYSDGGSVKKNGGSFLARLFQ